MTSAARVLELCARIATHTDVPGTITRTYLSPATRAVHALLRTEMEALGMGVRVDAVGNLRGTYAGDVADSPVLLVGSHIDTVPDAGAFDGILGVAVALELVRGLAGRRLPFAIEIIAFSEEEGVRFRLPFLGSRALREDLGAAEMERTDDQGVSVAQAIRGFGLDPERLENARMTARTFAFLEVHIEQGPVLESLDRPLAVVENIVGQTRFALTFTGASNHAGTTPMAGRRDALAATADFVCGVEALAQGTPGLVATVGDLQAMPGAVNIIPGLVRCSLDVRHADDAVRQACAVELVAVAESAGMERGVRVDARGVSAQDSVRLDPRLLRTLKETVADMHTMASGAGHDAMILAPHVPSAMLFVRSPGGISHHPDESVRVEDVQAALNVCASFIEALKSLTKEEA